MIIDISARTDRFNLSRVGADFINPCCFGEDFSHWLVDALNRQGLTASVICMEDFGWVNQARHGERDYLISIGGASDELASAPDLGTWHVLFERRRSLFDRLLGRGRPSVDEPIVVLTTQLLRDAGFAEVTIEPPSH